MLGTRNTVMAFLAATALTVPSLAAAQDGTSAQGSSAAQARNGMTEISCSKATAWMADAIAQSQQLSKAEKRQARESLEAARDSDSRRTCMEHIRTAHDIFTEAEAALILFDTNGKAYAGTDAGTRRRTVTAAAAGGQIVVEQPEPQVSVETPDPQVTVDQKRPRVTVRQPKPEVVVHQQKPTVSVKQPAPVVTVQQAQPDVTVNIPKPVVEIEMPEPDVNVASVEPEVSVRQAEPTIRFVRPEPEVVVQESRAKVQVDSAKPQVQISKASDMAAEVNVDRAEPEVRFESEGEPNVDVQQGEAKVRVTGAEKADVSVEQEQAEVRFEESRDAARNSDGPLANADRDPAARQTGDRAGAQEGEMRTEREQIILVMRQHPMFGARTDDLIGDDVYSAKGEHVGDVEQIAIAGDRIYAILGVGGILGIGDREVALPINRLAFANDRVTLPRLTEEDLESMPDIELDRYQVIPRERTLRQAYENR